MSVLSMRPVVVVALLLLPAAGTAQTYMVHKVEPQSAKGYDEVHLSKATLAGQQIRVWQAMMLNPDCTAAGAMTTQLLELPHHGKAVISDEPFFPGFVPPNPRAACNTHKAPGKQVFYTPDAGFHGRDKLVLENATSEGRVRRFVVDIDVR